MPDHGKDLGADLYQILTVAKDDLPSIAAIYHECKGKVDATSGVDGAMRRPDFFGGSLGPVHDAWVSVRDLLDRFLGDTSTNLEDTGHALELAVKAYAGTDADASAELDRLRQVNGEPHI